MPCYFLIFETGGNVVVPLNESSILRGALKLRALIPVSGKSVNDFLCIMKSATWGESSRSDVRGLRNFEPRTSNFVSGPSRQSPLSRSSRDLVWQ